MVVRQVYGLKLHGLPFGDEELRLLDAVVGGERLEQFATPLEDGLECGERNVLLRCRVFKIIYEHSGKRPWAHLLFHVLKSAGCVAFSKIMFIFALI